MKLHIFNPEHDIALASGLSNFTAPHAAQQLRHDLGFLPAVWAGESDAVLVDDVEQAQRLWEKTAHQLHKLQLGGLPHPAIRTFLPWKQTFTHAETPAIEPWGWNSALRATLLRRGIPEEQMPTLPQLNAIRQLSHRRTAASLLPLLRTEGTIGEAFECQTEQQVETLLQQYGQLVLKAPWSSSGRGLRFLSLGHTPLSMQAGWFRNLVQTQGAVMVEPFYNKVKDFGMEFYSDGKGHIGYLGLSLFHTANGAYTGNILATESSKEEIITRYIPIELLNSVKESICHHLSNVYNGHYCGPFGVDMMVTASPSAFLLHPCVEINLRRTMGHVALALAPKDNDLRYVMRIEYANNYNLKINRL